MTSFNEDRTVASNGRTWAPNALRPVLRAARCEHQAEAKPP